MDVIAVVGGDRPLPGQTQLPLHGVLSETLRLAAAARLRLPQLAEGTRNPGALSILAILDGQDCALPAGACRVIDSPSVVLPLIPPALWASISLSRYVRTTVQTLTLVRRGRCWVCWWMPTAASTCTSTAWTRASPRRISPPPATPSSTSTASVSRSVQIASRTQESKFSSRSFFFLHQLTSLLQVTIVTNSVSAVGAESGETRCQGDMEKADMVDGMKPILLLLFFSSELLRVLRSLRICRNQRERVLDTPSRGQPQQDLRVPGTVLPIQGPADVTR